MAVRALIQKNTNFISKNKGKKHTDGTLCQNKKGLSLVIPRDAYHVLRRIGFIITSQSKKISSQRKRMLFFVFYSIHFFTF